MATAFGAWLLLYMTGSLSLAGLPPPPPSLVLPAAFLFQRPDRLFQFPTVCILPIASHWDLLSEKPQRSSFSCVTFIWGLALDRRAREAGSRGRQLHFHLPVSGGCRQTENEPDFVRIQFRVTLARVTLALPNMKTETHGSHTKRRVRGTGFCGRGGRTVPQASHHQGKWREEGDSQHPCKFPLTVRDFTAFLPPWPLRRLEWLCCSALACNSKGGLSGKAWPC